MPTEREPSWTASDAQSFQDMYQGQVNYSELVTLTWEDADPELSHSEYAVTSFQIGGYLYETTIIDDQDVAPVYLTQDNEYYFLASSDYRIQIEIFDSYGYLLTSESFTDNETAQLAGYTYGDGIAPFSPSYSDWYYVWIISLDKDYVADAEILALNLTPESESEPFIIDKDTFNWDNDIDTGRNTYIAAEDAQLYRAYMGAMGRTPDLGGFNWWANEIELGRHDLYSMADGFVTSSEFKGYADTDFDGSISNHEFVTHMYEGVFGRSPDQQGYEYWMGELNSGAADQGDVLVNMTQSNEYIVQTLEAVAEYLFA